MDKNTQDPKDPNVQTSSSGDTSDPQETTPTTPEPIEPGTRTHATAPNVKFDDFEDMDEEEATTIGKVVNKVVAPVIDQINQQNDEHGLNLYLSANPDQTNNKDQIKKYMEHPAYKNIPIDHIANIVSAKDQQAIGAQKEREAQSKVSGSASAGSTARPAPSQGLDWKNMETAEFETQKAKMLSRQ